MVRPEAGVDEQKRLELKRMSLFGGIAAENLQDSSRLFDNGRRIARNLKVHDVVLTYLYSKNRIKGLSRAEWEDEVRISFGIDTVFRNYLRQAPWPELDLLIEPNAKAGLVRECGAENGTLILAYHGSFAPLVVRLFGETFREGFILGRGAAVKDPRTALFTSIDVLRRGGQVLVAPDGPFGKHSSIIRVLDIDQSVGDGAVFLAFQSKSKVVWIALHRNDRQFIPVAVPGPTPQPNETLALFRDRVHTFYAKNIEAALTGDPKNTALSGRLLRSIVEGLERAGIGVTRQKNPLYVRQSRLLKMRALLF